MNSVSELTNGNRENQLLACRRTSSLSHGRDRVPVIRKRGSDANCRERGVDTTRDRDIVRQLGYCAIRGNRGTARGRIDNILRDCRGRGRGTLFLAVRVKRNLAEWVDRSLTELTLFKNKRCYFTITINKPMANQRLVCRRTSSLSRGCDAVCDRGSDKNSRGRGVDNILGLVRNRIDLTLIENIRCYFTNTINISMKRANQMIACTRTSSDNP